MSKGTAGKGKKLFCGALTFLIATKKKVRGFASQKKGETKRIME